jgi:hypothetical protein
MEIVRKKLLDIKSSSYSREDKCDNRQTELVRNERRLSIERGNIPKNSENVAMLSKNRSFCIQRKQINKDIILGNSSVGPRQYRKRLKIKLGKCKRSNSPSPADPSSTESIEEIQRRRKNSYLDSSCLQWPSMVRLTRKNDYFDYTIGQIRKRTDTGENDEEERTPSATREFKCLPVKEFILHSQKRDLQVFDSSAGGKNEYCGPCQLQGMTLTILKTMSH